MCLMWGHEFIALLYFKTSNLHLFCKISRSTISYRDKTVIQISRTELKAQKQIYHIKKQYMVK
jgi:hypothetical protein